MGEDKLPNGSGVIIVWNGLRWRREGGNAVEVLVPGRAVSVALKSTEGEARMRIVGMYAPCRVSNNKDGSNKRSRHRERHAKERELEGTAAEQDEATQKARDMFDDVEDDITEDETVVMAGDMNAETREALSRSQREGRAQDTRMQEMMERCRLHAMSVGRATYRDKSEIDYVMTTEHTRRYLREAEWRPGQNKGDHGAVWVKLRPTTARDTQEHGPERNMGPRLRHMQKEGWKLHAARITAATAEAIEGVEDPKDRLRARQAAQERVAHTVMEELIKERKEARTHKRKGEEDATRPDDTSDAGSKEGAGEETQDIAEATYQKESTWEDPGAPTQEEEEMMEMILQSEWDGQDTSQQATQPANMGATSTDNGAWSDEDDDEETMRII